MLPTFRPDLAINILHPNWRAEIDRLRAQTDRQAIATFERYIRALEHRRAFFTSMGARATDHAAETPFTCRLSAAESAALFDRALAGKASAEDATRLHGPHADRRWRG